MLIRTLKRQRGASLLEILIGVLIFSIGLLGLAALQITAKRANYEAVQRSTAASLASGILERMRANPAGLEYYVVAGNLGGGSRGGAAPVNCGAAGANCATHEVTAYDLWAFEQELDGTEELRAGGATGGLAAPTACIAGPPGGSGLYTISIAWRGSGPVTTLAGTDCGLGLGRYGDADSLRRVVSVTTFIGAI